MSKRAGLSLGIIIAVAGGVGLLGSSRAGANSINTAAYLPITLSGDPRPTATTTPTLTPTPTTTSTPTATPKPTNTPTLTATPTRDPAKCHPSYPTRCIPPPPPDLNCDDIPWTNFTVLPPDPHGFDGNKNGIGCET